MNAANYGPGPLLLNILAPLRLALTSGENFSLFLQQIGRKDVLPEEQFEFVEDNLLPFANALEDAVAALASIDPEAGLDAATTLELLAVAEQVFTGVYNLTQLESDDLTSLVEPYNSPAFWQGVGLDMADYLLISYLRRNHILVYEVLRTLGVVYTAAGDEAESLSWADLPRVITDPDGLFRETYGEAEAFDVLALAERVAGLFSAVDLYARRQAIRSSISEDFYQDEPALPGAYELAIPFVEDVDGEDGLVASAGLVLAPVPADMDHPDGSAGYDLGLMPYADGSFSHSVPLNADGSLTLTLAANGDFAGGLLLTIDEDGFSLHTPGSSTTAVDGEISLGFAKSPAEGEETIRIAGMPGAFELSCESVLAAVGGTDDDFYICAGAEGLKLVIDVAEDGLLGKIVSGPIEADMGDLLAGYRRSRGFYFEQGGGMELSIPLSVKLGPVQLSELGFGLEFGDKLLTYMWMDGSADLGPLYLGVEGLGVNVEILPGEAGASRFGNMDLELSLRFPTGYAASLEAGPVVGGGYLSKQDKQYRGALALQFQNFGLSAFGILDTELPGGKDGYSFLATLFGEFSIPLGYGFFLTGLGGLIGFNRTSEIDALRDVLFEGRLDSILFPKDPIQDASTILDDLDTVFPSQEGQYLVGPMARIGWGTPTLIQGKIGLVFEFGAEYRVLILGSVGSALPTEDAAIIVLNVDFLGSIDFETGAVGFDAAITNSRILTWPVAGEMALRTGWGANAGLVASVGGLHPQYPLPRDFPRLQALSISFGTNNPSLTLTAYQAVTLNSVQAGAHASLYVKGPKIPFLGLVEVEGWAGFDALIIFNPFEFDAAMTLGLKLLIDGDTVCGIGGDLRLKGPNSYYIRGRVWVTILGFDVEVGVEKRWGTRKSDAVPEIDGLDELVTALANAVPDPITVSTRTAGVSFLTGDVDSEELVVDPNGGLQFTQKAIPLGVQIEKLGTAELKNGPAVYDIDVTWGSGVEADSSDAATSEFVHSAYWETSETEQLRNPAMDELKSGIEMASADDMVHPEIVESFDYEYETLLLQEDDNQKSQLLSELKLADTVFDQWLTWAGGFVMEASTYQAPELLSHRITMKTTEYAVVGDRISSRGVRVEGMPTEAFADSMLTGAFEQRRVVASYQTILGS